MSTALERLRAANPVPDCSPPPIEHLWRRIELDEDQQPSSGIAFHGPRPPRVRSGGIVAALLSVTAVATAVVMVILLAHSRPEPVSINTSPTTRSGPRNDATLSSAGALGTRVRALRGTPIVIQAWASWCRPCRTQLRISAGASARYSQQVAFLGADTDDTPADGRAYAAHHPLGYPTYPLTARQLNAILPGGLGGIPATIFIDPAGRIVYVHAGRYSSVAALERDIAVRLAPAPPTAIRTVPARLASAFAVFRRPRTAADALPAALIVSLTRGPSADAGINPNLARRVGPAENPAYLIPGRGGVGLYFAAGGGTYLPDRDAIDGELLSEAFRPPATSENVTGVVPDGVDTVTFKLANGRTQATPVHDNLYHALLSRHATTMTFTGPNGRVTVNL
jgi:thiol-disulfide isomerase/thioredoxin